MGRWKKGRHQREFFWGIFPKVLLWMDFSSSKFNSSSFTILVGSSYLTYLMIAKVNGNRGTHEQRLWVVLLPRPHPKTLIGCITVASRAPHVCNNLGTTQHYNKKTGLLEDGLSCISARWMWFPCPASKPFKSFCMFLVSFSQHETSQQVTSCWKSKGVSLPNRYVTPKRFSKSWSNFPYFLPCVLRFEKSEPGTLQGEAPGGPINISQSLLSH